MMTSYINSYLNNFKNQSSVKLCHTAFQILVPYIYDTSIQIFSIIIYTEW